MIREKGQKLIFVGSNMLYGNKNLFYLGKALLQSKWLIVAALTSIFVLLLPSPGPAEFGGVSIVLTPQGQAMLALLAGLIIVFLTEALPIGGLVGIVYAWVVFFKVLDGKEAAAIFSHEAVWFLIGALMMAQVVIKHNLHKRILIWLFGMVGTKTRNLVIALIAFCAISAAFIAEHLIVAMMLPIVLAIIAAVGGVKDNPRLTKLLLFSIAFGATIGSLATPSGGGRNVIAIGLIEEFSGISVGYGSWMLMAFPLTIVLIPILAFILLKTWKPEIPDLKDSLIVIKKEMQMDRMGIKEWGTALIFILVLYLWIFHSGLGIGMVALLGATLFLVFKLAEWKDYQNINWSIPMLYFGAIGLGTALQITGAAKWLAAEILIFTEHIIPLEGFSLLVFQTAIMSFFTEVMADGPAVATIAPTLMESAALTGADVVVAGVAMAIVSAFAFILVIGTPANAIIYGTGLLRPKDFLTTGIFIKIISIILLWVLIRYWWSFLGVGVSGFH